VGHNCQSATDFHDEVKGLIALGFRCLDRKRNEIARATPSGRLPLPLRGELRLNVIIIIIIIIKQNGVHLTLRGLGFE